MVHDKTDLVVAVWEEHERLVKYLAAAREELTDLATGTISESARERIQRAYPPAVGDFNPKVLQAFGQVAVQPQAGEVNPLRRSAHVRALTIASDAEWYFKNQVQDHRGTRELGRSDEDIIQRAREAIAQLAEFDDQRLQSEAEAAAELVAGEVHDQQPNAKQKRKKRRSSRTDNEEVIIATLASYHKYENGSCMNCEPIRAKELAELADVSEASVSGFWKRFFRAGGRNGSYRAYVGACQNDTIPLRLANWLGDASIGDALELHDERMAAKPE